MLDKISVSEPRPEHNSPAPREVITGSVLARSSLLPDKRLAMARAIAAGTATVSDLTTAQIAWLCRVPASAVRVQSKPKPKKAVSLKAVWDAAPVSERQDLVRDIFVLPLAG